jgi:hypothetical protein
MMLPYVRFVFIAVTVITYEKIIFKLEGQKFGLRSSSVLISQGCFFGGVLGKWSSILESGSKVFSMKVMDFLNPINTSGVLMKVMDFLTPLNTSGVLLR